VPGPAWLALRPLLNRGPAWIARGTLPKVARERLGLSWSPADEIVLRTMLTSLRASWPLVPRPLRYMPRARAAWRREEAAARAAARPDARAAA
jgi:uncharacterized protein (DUF2236 family)